jgi:hypothetical protein
VNRQTLEEKLADRIAEDVVSTAVHDRRRKEALQEVGRRTRLLLP